MHLPYDYSQAKQRAVDLARRRRDHETNLENAIRHAAEREGFYRKTMATEIVKAKAEHPATVAVEIARGSDEGIKSLVDRRVADGMVDVAKEQLKGDAEDRATLHRLIEWSMKVAPDGQLPEHHAR